MYRAYGTHGGDEMCTYAEHIGAITHVKSTEQTIEQWDVWGMEQTSE
jgi:hypothetical protein